MSDVVKIGSVAKGRSFEDQVVIEIIFEEGQQHVFRWWEELSEISRSKLIDQLRRIDFPLLRRLREQCLQPQKKSRICIEPVEVIRIPTSPEDKRLAERAKAIGEEVIRGGKLALFLVAGGQGTRLGYNGPKGCYPIGPVTEKSLFHIHAEKILAESRYYGVHLPWYIMTSDANDEQTKDFFDRYNYFGLDSREICFIKQRMLPVLDENGKLILDAKDHIFMSPNGHGGSLLALVESGALDRIKDRGVEMISYFQVDNVLIKIVDPVFIGFHVQAGAEMSSKMLPKRDPYEKVGVFGRVNGKLHVVEYSNMSQEDMTARNPDGNLKYGAGSIAIHLINTHFIEALVDGEFRLPYHVAFKKIPYITDEGGLIRPETPNGYKFETFVFDALEYTTHSVILEVIRQEEFSPVKNQTGEDSPDSAKRDLSNYFGKWLEDAGIDVPRDKTGNVVGSIEISSLYARSKDGFIQKLPNDLEFNGSLYLGS